MGTTEFEETLRRQELTNKRGMSRSQSVLLTEHLFESREIPHTAAVSREYFSRHYKDTQERLQGFRHNSLRHKLNQTWHSIVRRKSWGTISEVTLRRDIAAWVWLQTGHTLAFTQGGASLESALFSKFVLPEMLLHRISDDTYYLSLGNATWACLVWPAVVVMATDMHVFRVDPQGSAELMHITDPDGWEDVPCKANFLDVSQGIVLKHERPRQSLFRACLERDPLSLGMKDLRMAAKHLGLDVPNPSRKKLLEAIVGLIAHGDETWGKCVLDADGRSEELHLNSLLTDPTFEAAYEELPDEDKAEFPDIKKAVQKKRARQRAAESRVEAAKRKRQRRVRPRPEPAALAPAQGPPEVAQPVVAPEPAALAPAQGPPDVAQPVAKAKAKAKAKSQAESARGQPPTAAQAPSPPEVLKRGTAW